MSLLRASGTIGGLTLASRILGFVRDVLMARYVGAGFAADAFLVAFRLPNLFRALFAEGAFNAAFVPMFNQHLAQEEGRDAARAFAETVLSVLATILVVLTIVMIAAAAPLVLAMTGGYHGGDPAKFAYTVELTRLTIPYLALISLASLFAAVLNSLGRFWAGAAAPILLNLCLIAALIVWRDSPAMVTARAQAAAVTASGVLQLAWLIVFARRAGMRLRLVRPRFGAPIRRLLRLILPAALGAGALQVNLVVSTLLAARFLPSGAISHLYYADRLAQLPLGLIGIGVGTALLPLVSRHIARGDEQAARHSQNRAIELSLFLTLPAAGALAVSAFPLVAGLLAQGAFTLADAASTAAALAAFSLGIPAFVLIKVLAPGFHGRSDTRTPVRIALAAMAANLVLNLILVFPLGAAGLALSTSAAAWLNAGLLYLTLRRRGQFEADRQLQRTALKSLAATIAMAGALAMLNPIAASLVGAGFASRIGGLALIVGGGGAAYLVAAVMLRTVSIGELRNLTRRGGLRHGADDVPTDPDGRNG